MGASASSNRRSRTREHEQVNARGAPPPQQVRPQQPQQQQPTPHQQPQQNPPPAQGGQEAVSMARTVRNECTVVPEKVSYDAEQCLLKLSTLGNVTCEMEVHVAVRVDVMHGSCMITPNKPKAQPPKIPIAAGAHEHEIPLDLTNVSPQEKQYIQAYPKQIPVVVVLYYGVEGNMEKHPQAEYTMIQLEPECKMVKQLIRVDDGVYKVEHLYGGEHADVGTVVDSPVPEGDASEANAVPTADVEEDEDGLCVICLTNEKTTIVLPCRHLCLCKECAEELRQRSPKCPVCRGPVSQMLAVR